MAFTELINKYYQSPISNIWSLILTKITQKPINIHRNFYLKSINIGKYYIVI
jgi:hypothetical protein